MRVRPHSIILYAFDLLHLDGKDLRQQTLIERRAKTLRHGERLGAIAPKVGMIKNSVKGAAGQCASRPLAQRPGRLLV